MVEGISYIIYLIVMLPLLISFFIAFISTILCILNFILSYLGVNNNPLIIYYDDIQSLIQINSIANELFFYHSRNWDMCMSIFFIIPQF